MSNATSHLVKLHIWKRTCSLLTHSGVKAHTCSECKKAFSEAGSLRLHMITHTGEKVHKCAECGGSFGRAGNLKSHILTQKKRRHTSTHNAIMRVQKQEILEDTWKHIPYKSQMNANGASTPQSQNQISADICSPTVERGHITVKSVVGHLPKHEILKRTSAFTLGQNHTSVHDAVTQVVIPLTSNNTWPNIPQ